jgi:hypothetical protein
MPGHVLNLPQIVVLQPVSDNTGPDLFGTVDPRMALPDGPEHMQQTVLDVFTAVETDKKMALKPCSVYRVRPSCRSWIAYPGEDLWPDLCVNLSIYGI